MQHKKETPQNEPVRLVNVDGNYQLGLVTGILEKNDIPYFIKDSGVGGYMRVYSNYSIYGADIFVSPEHLERARELTDLILLDNQECIPDDGELEEL